MEEVLDKIATQAQKYIENIPVIVLGSGASVAYGLPTMWTLSEYLKDNIKIESNEQWDEFVNLLNNGTDLETALQNVTLDEETTKKIIVKTWELINPKDVEVFFNSLSNMDYFPLSKLINKFFTSTLKELNIITTNYDRLAEYACEKSKLYHYTGFSTGFYRTKVLEDQNLIKRKVNILKVHGSLDWFRNEDNLLIGLSNVETIPVGFLPEIVTPGIEKYKKTHSEPYRTIIQEADKALEDNNSYLCIGYGFNDEHIQEKLVNKCIQNNSKLLIITRTLTEATKKFITEQGCPNYLAFECHDDVNTKVYSSEFGEVVISNEDYWSLDGFLKLI
jgi:transcriptional regulator of NAD metabolism